MVEKIDAADRYVSLVYVGKLYGFSRESLEKMCIKGTLPGAAKCAGRWRVHLATLKAAWCYKPTPAGHGASVLTQSRKGAKEST